MVEKKEQLPKNSSLTSKEKHHLKKVISRKQLKELGNAIKDSLKSLYIDESYLSKFGILGKNDNYITVIVHKKDSLKDINNVVLLDNKPFIIKSYLQISYGRAENDFLNIVVIDNKVYDVNFGKGKITLSKNSNIQLVNGTKLYMHGKNKLTKNANTQVESDISLLSGDNNTSVSYENNISEQDNGDKVLTLEQDMQEVANNIMSKNVQESLQELVNLPITKIKELLDKGFIDRNNLNKYARFVIEKVENNYISDARFFEGERLNNEVETVLNELGIDSLEEFKESYKNVRFNWYNLYSTGKKEKVDKIVNVSKVLAIVYGTKKVSSLLLPEKVIKSGGVTIKYRGSGHIKISVVDDNEDDL